MNQPFTIGLVEGWRDITDEVESDAPPFTLARAEGMGAFQLSFAFYQSGQYPDASAAVLLSMLRKFAHARDLGEPADIATEVGGLHLAGASFRWQDDFLRVWFVSDGSNLAQVTYTCVWGGQAAELQDCEKMLRTLKFTRAGD